MLFLRNSSIHVKTLIMIKNTLIKAAKAVRKLYIDTRCRKYLKRLAVQIPEDASVFAMNCFGGHFSQMLHREYTTPTAGLFFYASDFNRIIEDINVIKRPIHFIEKSKYGLRDSSQYPIGVFEGTDIEIHFLHYPSPEVALEKWNRRLARFNFNKWIAVGFCQNLYNDKTIADFAALKYPHRVLFTNKTSYPPHVIGCREFSGLHDSPSAYLKGFVYYRYLTAYLDKYPLT